MILCLLLLAASINCAEVNIHRTCRDIVNAAEKDMRSGHPSIRTKADLSSFYTVNCSTYPEFNLSSDVNPRNRSELCTFLNNTLTNVSDSISHNDLITVNSKACWGLVNDPSKADDTVAAVGVIFVIAMGAVLGISIIIKLIKRKRSRSYRKTE